MPGKKMLNSARADLCHGSAYPTDSGTMEYKVTTPVPTLGKTLAGFTLSQSW